MYACSLCVVDGTYSSYSQCPGIVKSTYLLVAIVLVTEYIESYLLIPSLPDVPLCPHAQTVPSALTAYETSSPAAIDITSVRF